jgi:hypothetical protein
VFFARRGEMSSNRSEDHELSMLSLHPLQNCMVYVSTLMPQQVLARRFRCVSWLQRRRLIEEAERRRLREQEEAWRRKQRAERESRERYERERARAKQERAMSECYRICFREAYKAIGSPKGPAWPELPEAQQLRRDFPHDRPAWWAPPPGLFEAVQDYQAERERRVCEEPDWSGWVPPYVPGKAWPWRLPEPDEADGAA